MTAVLLIAGAGVAYVYKTTIGDVKHTSLLPVGVTQSPLPVDPYGNSALNILLIGSDTRDSAGDCDLGGDCRGGPAAGANADAEIVLHVSADRTNATVMSIPRDTETALPICHTDSAGNATVSSGTRNGQINSALQNGPQCQVAAEHYLTGITFTGYIMFDFDGVVSMSNALGGVPVCVTKAVRDIRKDSGSGLVLPAGVSTVQGNQALQFLRTRDSFFDGSDLGREEATHYFFTQMLQTLRSKLNFSNFSTLLAIGHAMASSTTVSNNFSGLTALEGLMTSLDKIPNKAITFVTMPWLLDPTDNARVIASQPDANTMFQNIQNDVSYTNNASPQAGPTTAGPTPTVPQMPATVTKADVSVNVVNADGVTGRAGAITTALTTAGFTKAASDGDQTAKATTEVYYPAGDSAQADAVAATLKIPAVQVEQSSTYSKVTVVIGTDFESGSTYTVTTTGGDTTGAPTAPTSAGEMNADSTGECIPVGSGTLAMGHE